jgi:hypothetical protein
MDSVFIQNKQHMKAITAFILIALIFPVGLPLTIQASLSPDSEMVCLVTLDVCHSSGSPGTVSIDMPFYCEGPAGLIPLEAVVSDHAAQQLFLPVAVSSAEERPPKV